MPKFSTPASAVCEHSQVANQFFSRAKQGDPRIFLLHIQTGERVWLLEVQRYPCQDQNPCPPAQPCPPQRQVMA